MPMRIGWDLYVFFVRYPYRCLSLTIARLLQLRDATKGLIYMHDQGIVHGDLKGVRIEPLASLLRAPYRPQGEYPNQ